MHKFWHSYFKQLTTATWIFSSHFVSLSLLYLCVSFYCWAYRTIPSEFLICENAKNASTRSQYVDYDYDYAKIRTSIWTCGKIQKYRSSPIADQSPMWPKMESNEKIYYSEIQMKKGCKIHIYTHGTNTYIHIENIYSPW